MHPSCKNIDSQKPVAEKDTAQHSALTTMPQIRYYSALLLKLAPGELEGGDIGWGGQEEKSKWEAVHLS